MSSNRAMWTGSISFGLVVVPVKLYTATAPHDIELHMVHDEDGGRIRFARTCEQCSVVVPPEHIAKGYEHGDGQVVVLTDDELKNLPVATVKTIEVVAFVDPERVSPLMFEKSYYVAAANGAGEAPYALLVAAMERNGRPGLVKVAIRNREAPALLRVHEGALILTMLAWPDELRDPPVTGYNGTPDPALLSVAVAMMDAMAGDFEPEKLTDEYAVARAALVAEKLGTARPAQKDTPKTPAASTSLADALNASLAQLQEKKPARNRRTAKPATDKPAAAPRRRAKTA